MKYIDLFAGVGGFHYGIDESYSRMARKRKRSGSTQGRQETLNSKRMGNTQTIRDINNNTNSTYPTCVYSNEWDKYANSVYRRHYGECDNRDIRTVKSSEIPDFDLLCGGFPCQSFSIAGKRRGFDDTRGTLFFEIARILKEKQPRLCLLENVKGLLSHDEGRTIKTIFATLDELGYDIQWQVCNSKDFGVPQNRERIFIIGHLRGTPRPQVFPIGEDDKVSVERQGKVSPTITQRYYKQGQSDPYIVTEKPKSGKQGVQQKGNKSNDTDSRRGKAHTTDKRLMAYSSSQRKDHVEHRIKDGEANCLTTGKGCAGGMKSMSFVKEEMKIRRLTPIESERLQGFPDNWTQYGADGELISDTQRYKMMGNAVTTNVITEIVKRLL